MSNDFEMLKNISAIYKCAFVNQKIHKNTMRNQLILKGKVNSKNRFYQAFDKLIATGGLMKEGDMVFLNPQLITTAVLQKEGRDDFYVVETNTKKHYRISKSVAASYKEGDKLNVVIEDIAGEKEAIVLGKNTDDGLVALEKKLIPQQEVVSGKENLILGRVVKISHDELVFIPNKKNLAVRQIPLLNDKEKMAEFQDKICLLKLADEGDMALGGFVVEVKGEAGNPIHEYDAIAESYGGIMSWEGDKIGREIAKIPTKVDVGSLKLITEAQAKKDQKGHIVDLRHIPFATVDPATCKDMDDAIYSTYNQNGDIVCYVAVANVTKYVNLKSEIGRRYIEGGFTIYAPNKAYNILPSKLSTGICSLNPEEDRLAFVVKATIDKRTGKVKKSRIYDALIQSRKKYSYEEAQNIVDEKADEYTKGYLMSKAVAGEELSLDEQVVMNYYAAQAIKQGFEERGMIRFVAHKERQVEFDEDFQNVVDIKQIPHLYYHEVIEAFMITANEATAKFAQDYNLDNIYRVHDEPNPQKQSRASEFFSILGVDFDGDLSAEGTRQLLEVVAGTNNEEVINHFLIKMQSRAVYSDKAYGEEDDDPYMEGEGQRISHYALQSSHYSHTTSPIRRVPDFITQYNILAKLHDSEPISPSQLQKIVDIANRRQIEVDQAERDFEDVNSAMYCEKHIGERMHGRITKIRMATADDGCEDDIIVIVKEQEKGIHAEIPISQITGRPSQECYLSSQGCAVYDAHGNVLITLCKPIDFIIERADRKSMKVIGRTDCKLVKVAEKRELEKSGRQSHTKAQITQPAALHEREKHSREERIQNKKRDRRSKAYDEERFN